MRGATVAGGFHGMVLVHEKGTGPLHSGRRRSPARLVGFPATTGVVAPVVHTATLIVDGAPVSVCVQGGADGAAEMRVVLSALGYRAACSSVAETVICGFLRWGRAFVHRLGPDALLCLWDGRCGDLTLVRGRAVPETLRYTTAGSVVCFCSAPFDGACPGVVGGACRAGSPVYDRDVLDPGCALTFGVRGSRLVTERRSLSAGTV